MEKPGGGLFFADPHQGGRAGELRIEEVTWGRLVDIHDVDGRREPVPAPVLTDVVVNENILSDGVDYLLETNAITHRTRLVILQMRDAGAFEELLRRATASLPPVVPKNDDGTSSEPFSLVARNAALLVRFDDLLDDGEAAREELIESVRVRTGYPPRTPFSARIFFDGSHGGLHGGEFHSTRVVVDLTVSEDELGELITPLPLNTLGLPASSELTRAASAALRFPTRLDPGSGRFARVTNLAGEPLAEEGPLEAQTGDLVRAMRAGNAGDANGGFLLDLQQPRVIGTWDVVVLRAVDDPAGAPGFGFLLDLRFTTPCRAALRVADVLDLGGEVLEVLENSTAPDASNTVAGVRGRRLAAVPLGEPAALLGTGRLLTPYPSVRLVEPACWLSFAPPPREPPGHGVSPESRVSVRFSEPMDPASFRAFDTWRVIRGSTGSTTQIFATDLVVGDVSASEDLQVFSFQPRLPFANDVARDYHAELVGGLAGVRDIGGNPLAAGFGRVDFELDPLAPLHANGGLALRLDGSDEIHPPDGTDLRGQLTVDTERGILLPRPTAFGSAFADRVSRVPQLMMPFGPGVQTPLSPLGSKVQAMWRYADFGWRVADESRHNLDVIGLAWSPVGGSIVADFFPGFEIRLAHAKVLHDETKQQNTAPRYPTSGLFPGPIPYTENLLVDPRSPQTVVHPRSLGYRLNPADVFLNGHGVAMMPFPMNRSGGGLASFLWRDTAVLAQGGLGGPGIPLDIEVGSPLFIEPMTGALATGGQVPSIGLPLLWEVRCYPSFSSIGLNALDILLPVPGFPRPNFRAFSTGGIDTSGRLVTKDPDLELAPSGGFNPSSRPPGLPTSLNADNSFYVGQIDIVVRVSRSHTSWIDTAGGVPRFANPVVEPAVQPAGTSILLEFRGADSFSPDAEMMPFDAQSLDWYGDLRTGEEQFHGPETWTGDIRTLDGARFLQVRLSFFNNIESRLSPVLDSLGIAWER